MNELGMSNEGKLKMIMKVSCKLTHFMFVSVVLCYLETSVISKFHKEYKEKFVCL